MSDVVDVKAGIKNILDRIAIASQNRPKHFTKQVQLVAVSKTKPVEAIIKAYEAGQRHFGENYVQELQEKANSPLILEKCKDINWHFIGHLQGNKVNKIVKFPRLYMIETIDSVKLAESVNSAWQKHRLENDGKLKILIQVNTSGEENKSGIKPEELTELYQHMTEKCTALEVDGLMTIGEFGYDYLKGPNPDFVCLMECAARLPNTEKLELSFGMSDDFEKAIEMGSTIVRVGSSIFGFRPKKE
ncbi:hypothetical protein PVAND_004565 [Polypedilum vanderplanki]|uniref:Pyridoxal phosphate homeostasis protein n=1 Tax=Polypedilum vanderplanki TaxID=319348 RepID=A0A9J6BYI1_POLVA|nr:hypothetical protein PVAND_004565 [Polypedilum vanderplanki]